MTCRRPTARESTTLAIKRVELEKARVGLRRERVGLQRDRVALATKVVLFVTTIIGMVVLLERVQIRSDREHRPGKPQYQVTDDLYWNDSAGREVGLWASWR